MPPAQLHWAVIDKTGLSGFYDMKITQLPAKGDADGTIKAVRESLGLNLELGSGTGQSLIIDQAKRPE